MKPPASANDVFKHAVQLLAARDYTTDQLRKKLALRFGEVPDSVIEQLTAKHYLDDHRYAQNLVRRRKARGPVGVQEELAARGIPAEIIANVIQEGDWPSLQEALKARMVVWNLRPPLQRRDAARLFRALARLGYEEDAIREEIDQLHEQ